jgi:2-amino-4-hydroxy-6-hydroxymethyldihydropteridine diphosphokinase
MSTVYLLLGSNIGDRLVNLADAKKHIGCGSGVVILESDIYRTAAWGNEKQADFFNQVIKIITDKDADQLLKDVGAIEESMGRIRSQKYEARIIDIDILFFNNEIIQTPRLKIPHAEIANRRFVLTPLEEIASRLVHPVLKKMIKTLLIDCKDQLNVQKI